MSIPTAHFVMAKASEEFQPIAGLHLEALSFMSG
jgi:hypothetical protein